MTWPLSQDYNEAVQDPSVAFSDPELRAGEAVANALGIPQPRAGNFADVYELRCPTGNRWAIKCFTRETPDLQNRYVHISRHLAQKRDRLPFIVDFHYLAQGIRVRGRWYPVLKMRWVEGFLLNQFVRDNLEQPQLLLNLAQLWHRMGRRLRETGAAHGDLQHGNVILVPAAGGNSLLLRLIDYDGMYVPSLAGMRASEVGHPSYQHPQRLRDRPWSPEVDRFPLLAIYTAIRALAVGGRALWEKYDNGDNMLFRESDFRNTTASQLMRDLTQLGDPEVARLANVMSRATFKPLDLVPLLSELVSEPKPPEKPAVVAVPVAAVAVPVEPRRRVPALLWVSALVGVLVLVLGGFYLASGGVPGQTPVASEPAATDPENPEAPKETRPAPRATNADGPTGKRGPRWESGIGEVCRFVKHGDPVQTVGFTADGKNVLAWSGQTLRLWNIEALNEAWGRDVGGIERVAVSPNGRLAAFAQADGIHLLDLTTRQEMEKLQSPESKNKNRSGVTALAFDAGGRMLLAAGRNGNLHLHTLADRSDRKYPLPTDRKNQEVRTCSLSPDGEHFIHDFGPDVRVVRVASNIEVFRGPPHFTRPVTAVAALPDNVRFVTAGEDRNLFVRTYAGGQDPDSGKTRQAMKALAVSPNGTRVLSCGDERRIYLWDLKKMKQPVHLDGHEDQVLSVAFSPDGKMAVSGGKDESVRVWRLPEGAGGGAETPLEKDRELLKIDAKTVAHRIAISPDDGLLLAATPEGVRSWTEEGKPIPRRPGSATALATLPKGHLVFGGADGELRQESTTGAGTRLLGRHGKAVRDLALSPSGMFALSCSGEPSAILWDVAEGKEQQRFGGPQDAVTCVALSGDGLLALTGGGDGMRLWEVASGNEVGRLDGHKGEVLRAVFFAANRYVASAGEDGTVRLWHVKLRRELRRFELRKDEARALAVSPDGRRLLAGGVSGVVRMWDVAGGKELPPLVGHVGPLRDVALSSDGGRALTAGEDGTLRLWQLPDVAGGGALDLGTDPVKP